MDMVQKYGAILIDYVLWVANQELKPSFVLENCT